MIYNIVPQSFEKSYKKQLDIKTDEHSVKFAFLSLFLDGFEVCHWPKMKRVLFSQRGGFNEQANQNHFQFFNARIFCELIFFTT